MASLPLSLAVSATSVSRHRASPFAFLHFRTHFSPRFPPPFSTPKLLRLRLKSRHISRLPAPSANVSGPGPGPDPVECDPVSKLGGFGEDEANELGVGWKQKNAINCELISSLLSKHKLRLFVSVCSLLVCTTCTLSMPIFSGRFFEVLIGKRPEPLWQLLTKIGFLYALEPVFTVIFVVNMNTIWEKVMSVLRAQLFRRVLIQKVEFFDHYKERPCGG